MREAFHRTARRASSTTSPTSAAASRIGRTVRHRGTAQPATPRSAERVIKAPDIEIDRSRERVEDTAFSLLSLQQPVAGDLRVVVSALRMVTELERMGDLSVHVAKIARLRVPNLAVPADVPADHRAGWRWSPRTWSTGALEDHHRAATSTTPSSWCRDDEEMDQLRRASFAELLSAGLDPRRRGRRRRRPARPLLRADRRPRRLGREPGRLRGHRREPEVRRRLDGSIPPRRRTHGRDGRSTWDPGTTIFRPWVSALSGLGWRRPPPAQPRPSGSR